MKRDARLRFGGPGEAGFSILELLISTTILLVIVLLFGVLADRAGRISKVENTVTGEQQGVRYSMFQVARELRMTAAGGAPASLSVVSVRQLGISLDLGSTTYGNGATFFANNVNSVTDTVMIGGTHHVRKGTDIVHIRGVITTSVYDLSGANWTPGSPATLVINPCSKYKDPAALVGAPCYPYAANDMSAFSNPSALLGRLFILSDTYGNVGVGLITAPQPTMSAGAATVKIDTTSNAYMLSLNPGGAFPTGLTNSSRGGILDDRVYFIDDGTTAPAAACGPANAGVSPGPCHPVFSVADWTTGDTTAAPFSTAAVTPIADDVEDLQVAYGMDFYNVVNNTGTFASPVPDGSISLLTQATFNSIVSGATTDSDPSENAVTKAKDEWLGNVTGELGAAGTYSTFNETADLTNLKQIEIAIVAKGQEPDPKYKGIGATGWKIMDSTAKAVTADNTFNYHRRVQTVRIDLRNFQFQ